MQAKKLPIAIFGKACRTSTRKCRGSTGRSCAERPTCGPLSTGFFTQQQLDPIRAPIAKHIHRSRESIESQGLLGQRRLRIDCFAILRRAPSRLTRTRHDRHERRRRAVWRRHCTAAGQRLTISIDPLAQQIRIQTMFASDPGYRCTRFPTSSDQFILRPRIETPALTVPL